jgi:subtilisin family serine protease
MILPVTIPGVSLNTDATVVALNRLTAMARPPQVVNMSYSAGGSCPAEVQAAVRQAVRAGMILVAAAGNAGATGNPPTYPASCAGVVAVGAVDRRNRVWPGSARQTYVAVAGPGVHMIGADPAAVSGYGYGTGTSDAAAIVSGSFALLRSHYPSLSSRTLVTRVLHTARQFVGASGSRNADLGYGVVRPYDALSRAVPADAPNPVYAAPDSPAVAASATSSPRRDAATGDPDGALRILAIAAALVALAAAPAVWGTRRRRRAARE